MRPYDRLEIIFPDSSTNVEENFIPISFSVKAWSEKLIRNNYTGRTYTGCSDKDSKFLRSDKPSMAGLLVCMVVRVRSINEVLIQVKYLER